MLRKQDLEMSNTLMRSAIWVRVRVRNQKSEVRSQKSDRGAVGLATYVFVRGIYRSARASEGRDVACNVPTEVRSFVNFVRKLSHRSENQKR